MTDKFEDGNLGGEVAGGVGLGLGDSCSDSDRVVSARGTEDGLIIRIDGRAEWNVILREVRDFLAARRSFIHGGEVAIEWLDRLPTKEQTRELEELLQAEFDVRIIARKKREGGARRAGVERNSAKGGVTIPLFNPVESAGQSLSDSVEAFRYSEGMSGETKVGAGTGARGSNRYGAEMVVSLGPEDDSPEFGKKYLNRMAKVLGEDLLYEEEANGKVVFGTLRSGQRIETPFSLVVIGDVNPGADLIAGGDIVVMGSLRGTAHAAAYDDESPDRVIIALHMQPMQLRIGSVISRGSDEPVKGAEIARIEDRRIVVESFHPRSFLGRKSR